MERKGKVLGFRFVKSLDDSYVERLPLFSRVEHDVPSYLLVVTWVRRVRLEFEWGCAYVGYSYQVDTLLTNRR